MKSVTQSTTAEAKFLTILGIIVGLIGVPAFHSLMKTDPPVVTDGVLKSSRSPATAAIPTNQTDKVAPTNISMNWPCDADNVKVDTQQLRLRGNECLKGLSQIHIVNQSNGFTASIFPLSSVQFTTDFIDLKEGSNNFFLVAVDQSGQKVEKTVVVHRAPASTK